MNAPISLEEALEFVSRASLRLDTERVQLIQAAGRILAQDVLVPRDHPARDTSAMDGFAGAYEELSSGEVLTISGESLAGQAALESCHSGVCYITTGAGLPPGCDTVVPIEHIELDPHTPDKIKIITPPAERGEHVRLLGEHLTKGGLLYANETCLTVQDLWCLANNGFDEVLCYQRPVVGVVTGGDELVEPGEQALPGQEYNGNSIGLAAWIQSLGAVPVTYFFSSDRLDLVMSTLDRALSECDLVLTVGSASKGSRDHIGEALLSLGGEWYFKGVKMRPGKPTGYATCQGKSVFVLPGNPVSAAVGFAMLVKPLLNFTALKKSQARIDKGYRSRRGITMLLRGRRYQPQADSDVKVQILAQQNSHCFSTIAQGEVLVVIPEESSELAEGELVEVIEWQR